MAVAHHSATAEDFAESGAGLVLPEAEAIAEFTPEDQEIPAAEGRTSPTCLDGAGACPPEDCGGAPGYENLRLVLADPTDGEHEDLVEWLGLTSAKEFDPARFDPAQADKALAAL